MEEIYKNNSEDWEMSIPQTNYELVLMEFGNLYEIKDISPVEVLI